MNSPDTTGTPSSPSLLDSGQRTSLLAIVQELRALIEASVSLDADPDTLDALALDLRSVRERMEPVSGTKALEHFNVDPGDDLNSILPCSPVTGRFNPLAPPLEVTREGERLMGRATLGRAYEGPPQSVHGAVVSAIYDQLLALANAVAGTAGPTVRLEVDYLRPTPLLTPLEFSAWVARKEGRKITLQGECHANGELITRCEGLFIQHLG